MKYLIILLMLAGCAKEETKPIITLQADTTRKDQSIHIETYCLNSNLTKINVIQYKGVWNKVTYDTILPPYHSLEIWVLDDASSNVINTQANLVILVDGKLTYQETQPKLIEYKYTN